MDKLKMAVNDNMFTVYSMHNHTKLCISLK